MRPSNRTRLLSALAAAAAAALALGFAPTGADTSEVGAAAPGVGGISSDGVEHLAWFPAHVGTAGGRLLDGHFYVTDPRGVYIYDVSTPETPALVGSLDITQAGLGLALGQEDPDTNGEILLVDAYEDGTPASRNKLLVIDVSDKADPSILSSVDVTDHTWTCINGCTGAIGRSGHIVDLRDPANPVQLEANWKQTAKNVAYAHDLTEVRPGIVLSSGQPSHLLDVRDMEDPVLLGSIASSFSTYGYHGNTWPRGGTDRWLLIGTELSTPGARGSAGSDCNGEGTSEGVLHSYDASAASAALDAYLDGAPDSLPVSFGDVVGEYMLPGRGAFVDGSAPGNTLLYCTHWFDAHPDFADGGLVALASYDWGTRFLEVGSDGSLTEVGWFQPIGGLTGASYWISEDVVYAMDYRRGMDVLRFTPPAG